MGEPFLPPNTPSLGIPPFANPASSLDYETALPPSSPLLATAPATPARLRDLPAHSTSSDKSLDAAVKPWTASNIGREVKEQPGIGLLRNPVDIGNLPSEAVATSSHNTQYVILSSSPHALI
jgi:hypothetical protein